MTVSDTTPSSLHAADAPPDLPDAPT
jgi:hypothetical protein